MIKAFETIFYRRKSFTRRSYELDENLYCKLIECTKIYKADISDLINLCIEELIKNRNIYLYENKEKGIKRSFYLVDEYVKVLEEMKTDYGISVVRLINLAIKNVLDTDINE